MQQYNNCAEKAAKSWISGQYVDSALYPGLGKLPEPLQLRIFCERKEVELLIQEGHDQRNFDRRSCFLMSSFFGSITTCLFIMYFKLTF